MVKKAISEKTLSEKTITEITGKLAHFLADTFVLYVKTLNFHWNMVGPQFFMYHKLLQSQYEALAVAADDLAERIRMLGRIAPGSMQEFIELSCLKEAPKTRLSEEKMIQELANDHDSMVEHCHRIIPFMDSVYDQGTSDLIIDRIRAHDKEAWLLKSHLEKRR